MIMQCTCTRSICKGSVGYASKVKYMQVRLGLQEGNGREGKERKGPDFVLGLAWGRGR